MPTYRIKQREIHESTFDVKAKNLAEAIASVWNGDGSPDDTEFVEVMDNCGLDINRVDPETIDRLRGLGELSSWATRLTGISSAELIRED